MWDIAFPAVLFIAALWGMEKVCDRLPAEHPLAGVGGRVLLGILLGILFLAAVHFGVL